MADLDIAILNDRIKNMTEPDRLLLDPICEALQRYQASSHSDPDRGFVLANRVAALAAVDVMQSWEKSEWERG